MKQIDFENGGVGKNILAAALPMLIAQILNLLYNIVDRVYIARIPQVGTAALGAVGLWFSSDCYYQCLRESVRQRRVPRFFPSTEEKKRIQGPTRL